MKILFGGRISLSLAYTWKFPLPFEETSVPYNSRRGERAPERIPLIIYHYIVIVRHMFSVLRESRRVGSPSHVNASHDPMLSRQGRKRNKVIATTPGNATKYAGSIFEKKDAILTRIRRETTFDWGTLSLNIYLFRLITNRVCRSRLFTSFLRF